jgi:hypothetical protein
MDTQELFAHYLTNLDLAYQDLRNIHSDPEFINNLSPGYKNKKEAFSYAESKLWEFKQVLVDSHSFSKKDKL